MNERRNFTTEYTEFHGVEITEPVEVTSGGGTQYQRPVKGRLRINTTGSGAQ
jgi:hypothetical protein